MVNVRFLGMDSRHNLVSNTVGDFCSSGCYPGPSNELVITTADFLISWSAFTHHLPLY